MRHAQYLLVIVALLAATAPRSEVSVANDLAADIRLLDAPQACVLDAPRTEAMLADLFPRIERAAGKSFRAVPRVRLASPIEFAEALGTKFVNDAPIGTAIKPQEAALSNRLWSREIAPLLLGFYSSVGDTVFLSPTRILDLVQVAGGTVQDCEAVIRLVVTHELAHALQSQHLGLVQSRAQCASWEQFNQYQSRIEGHANAIVERVAESLDVHGDTLETAYRIIVGAVLGDRGGPGSLGAFLEEQYEEVAVAAALVDSTIDGCGNEAVWTALGKPCDEISLLDRLSAGQADSKSCEP